MGFYRVSASVFTYCSISDFGSYDVDAQDEVFPIELLFLFRPDCHTEPK